MGPPRRGAGGCRAQPLPGGGCRPVRVGPPAPGPFVLAELDGRVALEVRVGGLASGSEEFSVRAANRPSSRRRLTARGPLEVMADLLGVEGLLV